MVGLTSWGEVASLAFFEQPSNDGVMIKIPYVVDVLLHQCYYLLGYSSEHSLLDGSFDLWP